MTPKQADELIRLARIRNTRLVCIQVNSYFAVLSLTAILVVLLNTR